MRKTEDTGGPKLPPVAHVAKPRPAIPVHWRHDDLDRYTSMSPVLRHMECDSSVFNQITQGSTRCRLRCIHCGIRSPSSFLDLLWWEASMPRMELLFLQVPRLRME